MLLKLNESITCGGVQYRPPTVVDTEVLKVSDAEAMVLVRRGTAVVYQGTDVPAPVAANAPEVVDLGLGRDEAPAVAPVVLTALLKAELIAMATGLGIAAGDMTKAQLIEAIEAAQSSASE